MWKRRHGEDRFVLSPDLTGLERLEQAVARCLDQVAAWVPGQAYHAYWLNDTETALELRAGVLAPGTPSVVPNYSGLVAEEAVPVPLSLPASDAPREPRISGARTESWLELPVGRHLLVRVLLKSGQRIPPHLLERLGEAGNAFAPLTLAIHEWMRVREREQYTRKMIASTQSALDTTLRLDRSLELLLTVSGNLSRAVIQFGIVEGPDKPLIVAPTAEGRDLGRKVLAGEFPELLVGLTGEPDVLPGATLPRLGDTFSACVRIPIRLATEVAGCLFCLTHGTATLDHYQYAVLRTLSERAAQLVVAQRQMQQASAGYLETLRVLVNAFDGISSDSLGHSDRLARYARLTAISLGLPAPEVEAIAMAAFFHDVGMIAVDRVIVLKPDRLSTDEIQSLKAHPVLGAQLLGSLPAALPLGPMVAGHHERWDGHGYPQGIRGEQIPLGARIISVADLFDAQTTARPYRPPTPVAQALKEIQSAAGSQLDPDVAAAFLDAWERLRRETPGDLPPGRCWEMKQMPAHVCSGCPNRVPEVVRCWDSPRNECGRHGDRCDTCLVYTSTQAPEA